MQTTTNTKTTKPAAPNATRANELKTAATNAKPAKVTKEPKVDPVLTKTIKVVSATNPKREGSKSHARFALYSTDAKKPQTVIQYIEASVAAGQSRRAARADIQWDLDHKFIELN